MKKPAPVEDSIYDIHEVIEYIGKKYKINPYDFYDSSLHFNSWCDAQGYGKKDPQGKDRNSSQIWFQAYQTDPQGNKMCPPYEDFWKYFIDWYSPQTNELIIFDVKEHLSHTNSKMMTKMLNLIELEFGNEIECMLTDC